MNLLVDVESLGSIFCLRDTFNIEMQMEGHRAFAERMYMYMEKMYVSQDEVAKEYTRYKRAIQIIITNFELLKEKELHNVYKITNQKSRSIFTTHFETHVLELPKLKEENGLLTTELEKWLLFLKGDQKVKEELAMESTTMKEAYEEIERLSQNPETKRLAEYRERELKDIQQREYDAREDGKEKEKKEVVIKMYGEDLPTELISKITGLTLEEISEIIKSI